MHESIIRIFYRFWDARKPYWKGSDIALVEDILADPDFVRSVDDRWDKYVYEPKKGKSNG